MYKSRGFGIIKHKTFCFYYFRSHQTLFFGWFVNPIKILTKPDLNKIKAEGQKSFGSVQSRSRLNFFFNYCCSLMAVYIHKLHTYLRPSLRLHLPVPNAGRAIDRKCLPSAALRHFVMRAGHSEGCFTTRCMMCLHGKLPELVTTMSDLGCSESIKADYS